MKIKKFKFKHILKLYLLKSKIYEHRTNKFDSNFSIDNNLENMIKNFKKILRIIFHYHKEEKRILFIGMPKKLEIKINKLTNHVAVPFEFEFQGAIINNFKSVKSIESLKSFLSSKIRLNSLLFKLTKKPDLVVLYSHKKKQSILVESYFTKTPLILLNTENVPVNLQRLSFCVFHSVENNFQHCLNTTFFFFSFSFLFKVSKKTLPQEFPRLNTFEFKNK